LAAEPGGTAIITTPDGLPSLRAITPTPTNWRNELVARMTLRIGFYRPVLDAADVRCPLLVCMADGDRLAKPSAARRLARAAPRGELRRYRSGHFGLYVGKGFRRAMADQAEFVARHLALAAEERAA
jgi:poly(3-hydroxyalkanoate) synthetase